VYRALLRHGPVARVKRNRRRSDYRRWERGRAMELWQMDIVAGSPALALMRPVGRSHGHAPPV